MLAFRLLHGAGACVSAAGSQAYTADVTNKPHLLPFRGAILGVQSVFIGGAYVVGPALGGLLTEVAGPRMAYGAVGGCALICAAILSRLPETLMYQPGSSLSSTAASSEFRVALQAWSRLSKDPAQCACLVGMTATNFNWALAMVALPFQAAQLGATPWWTGLMFAAGAVVSTGMSPVGGVLSDRYGRSALVVPGLVLMALGNVALAAATSFPQMTGAFLLWSVAEGLLLPAFFAFAADCVPDNEKAQAFSLHRMAGDATMVIAPLALGLLVDTGGTVSACSFAAAATAASALAFRRLAAGVINPANK
eukprot:gnl/TRDRNA2_/TRDRNA2_145174_c0_seq1.p1 gnl/TRDRNA2_/TRDRNA2_145174_c0~~gnl/TRDRNA2_/TRDRNA2_145174_c0_seq1.p1  ORF type:complete len:337 (-),score=29.17 gnl/TRDRNA2_/TRDRNA2_145174_c0_seq1:1-924(-)